jgi:tRNA pseudouridine55 synthase
MGRRKKGDPVNGWINLDKPEGIGSTQAVGKVRWLLNAQKAGHAGTLDPLASGVLPIALGEATKTIPFCQDELKTYSFTVKWGEQRSTDDREGEIIEQSDKRPAQKDIEALLPKYTGDIEQTPPQFSAIKVDGERAYDRAREGLKTEIKSRQVYIKSFELTEMREDETDFLVVCGKGTYIRALARDMGQELGCFGYIKVLCREAVGPFTRKDAISLAKFEEMEHSAALLPVETALDDIPALALTEQEASRLRNGQFLSFVSRPDVERLQKAGIDIKDTGIALAVYKGKAIALIDVQGVEIKPHRILNV